MDEIQDVGNGIDVALIALGWMRGVINGYDDDTMAFFLDEAKEPANMIAGLTNLCTHLLYKRQNEAGQTPKQTLDEASLEINSLEV